MWKKYRKIKVVRKPHKTLKMYFNITDPKTF